MKSLSLIENDQKINELDYDCKIHNWIKRKSSLMLKLIVHFSFKQIQFEKKKMLSFFFFLELLTNKKGLLTRSSKNVAVIGLRKGFPTGVKVTLRKQSLINWLNTLLLALPRNDNFSKINISSTNIQKGISSFSFVLNELSFFYQIEKILISYINNLILNWVSSLSTWQENIYFLTNNKFPVDIQTINYFQKLSLQKHYFSLNKILCNKNKQSINTNNIENWYNWIKICYYFFNLKKIISIFNRLDFSLFFMYNHFTAKKRIQFNQFLKKNNLCSYILPNKYTKFIFQSKQMFKMSSITTGNILVIYKINGGLLSKKEFLDLIKNPSINLLFGNWNGFLYRASYLKFLYENFNLLNIKILNILYLIILKIKSRLFYLLK